MAFATRSPWVATAAMLAATTACFPTMQTARIENGLHFDMGFAAVGDQPRNGRPQGMDVIPWVAPVVGLGGWVELGIPIGYYAEGGDDIGAEDVQFFVWPFLKMSMLEPGGRDHLALVLQGAYTLPANIGLWYGRELDGWEPHAGVSIIFSGGPAGDDPIVTRYQEAGQFIMAFGAGATWLKGEVRPSVEVGLMRNHYNEGAVFGDFGQPTSPRTLYDLYVAARLRL